MTVGNQIDLTGMKCPMPIVHLTKLMRTLNDGDEVEAVANDPAFCLDVEAWCNQTGNELLALAESNNQLTAKIRKSAAE